MGIFLNKPLIILGSSSGLPLLQNMGVKTRNAHAIAWSRLNQSWNIGTKPRYMPIVASDANREFTGKYCTEARHPIDPSICVLANTLALR